MIMTLENALRGEDGDRGSDEAAAAEDNLSSYCVKQTQTHAHHQIEHTLLA